MARAPAKTQRYVVLPTRGLRASPQSSAPGLGGFLAALNTARSPASTRAFVAAAALTGVAPAFKVLDSISEDGAKLVEMSPEVAMDLKANEPGLRIVPEVFFKPAVHVLEIATKVKAAAAGLRTVITVQSQAGGTPVRGATVVAFTNFAARAGAQGVTNAKGQVSLALGGAKKLERVYVYPPSGFWSGFRKNVSTALGVKVALAPVNLGFTDSLRHFYGNAADTVGSGVTVGVVDTGVGPHPDLAVAGGLNTVGFNDATGKTEPPTAFGDNGQMHGTHVAGIVAARGTPPAGLRGLAPGATLRSYRVFGEKAEGASNFAIAKAIDAAARDGCDLINLSLGGGPSDPATASAIHDARQLGCVVVAATGNDGREPVSFPGADPLCVAVTALGVVGTFPKGTVDDMEVAKPSGTADKNEFIAGFSNVGPEADLTGPGVGVLSTVPGGYAPMSGTSMASPAVAGFAARLFSEQPDLLAMTRDQARSDALVRALMLSAKDRGFPAELQGNGLPLP